MEPVSGELGSEHYGFDADRESPVVPLSAVSVPDGSAEEASLRDANARLKAELEAAKLEIEHERQRLEAKQREVVGEWEKRLAELETLQSELSSERAALRAAREATPAEEPTAEVEAVNSPGEPKPAAPPVDEAQAAPAESWREQALRAMAAAEDEATSADEPERRQPRQAAAASEPHEDDGSIQEYFAALLHRNREGSSGAAVAKTPARRKSDNVFEKPAPAPRPTTPACVTAPSATTGASLTAAASDDVVVEAAPAMLAELERRPRADVTDLSAMRELANAQARAAIHTHSQKKLVRTLVVRLGGAVACFIGGLVGMNLTVVNEQGLVGAAMAAMVVGVYLLFIAAKDGQQIRVWLTSREAAAPKSKDAEAKCAAEPNSSAE
jgi:hypothetical protein